jgi:hypothetical protein
VTPPTREDPKDDLLRTIDALRPRLAAMSDFIFDHPEVGLEEVQACGLLCDFLAGNGFQVAGSARAARASDSCANTTPSPAWATRAPITSRARASSARPWPSRTWSPTGPTPWT